MLPQIYSWIIYYKKWWMGNADIVQMVNRVQLRTKACQWIVHQFCHFCSDNFYHSSKKLSFPLRIWSHLLKKSLMKNLIFLCSVCSKMNSVIYHSRLSPKWICETAPTSKDSFFILHEIHISKKQSLMRWMSVRLTSFIGEFCNFLDFHKTIFGSIHAWLDKNIGQNPALHHLPLFKNLFCQHNKNWLGPVFGGTLAKSQITKLSAYKYVLNI